ncbi:hypothetical protein K523DRAFT_235678 [Schizophyllum commune Tattone D]|nr:hypothetical protein K523DRAFT_235678 [Schizophyllum commune Tattone D]
MHPLLRNTLIEISRAPSRANLASVASSSRRVFNVDHLRSYLYSKDTSREVVGLSDITKLAYRRSPQKLAKLAQDGINSASPLDGPTVGSSTVNDSQVPADNIPAQEADRDQQRPHTRRARPPPLRKRVVCVDNVVDGTSLRKLKDLMSHEFGDVAWISIGMLTRSYFSGTPHLLKGSARDDHPERRQAYVLFKHASSIDNVRTRLGSLIDFDGVALRAELIPPVAVGGPTNAELRDRLYPRKEPLHPVGVRPKDTLFVRQLEDEDVEELRKHIEASFSDLVSLTRLGSCLELRFADLKAASRARTALKDHFRRSNSTSWVDFKTDEGDLPVVLRAQKKNRAEQLHRLQRALANPARGNKESVQAAIEVAQQKLDEVKEKLARVEELAAKSE